MKLHRPCVAALFCVSTAFANDTALHEGRQGPEPVDLRGRESPVRMVSERINVEFGHQESKVRCTFTFRNTNPSGEVEQLVGFPDIGAAAQEWHRRHPEDDVSETVNTPPMRRLETRVNGKRVKAAVRYGESKRLPRNSAYTVWSRHHEVPLAAWHTMKVVFPVGKDVTIERRYTLRNATSAAGVRFFSYTTATGSPWAGTIGRLEVDVTLRDGLTVNELVWSGRIMHGEKISFDLATSPGRKGWEIVDDKHLRMVWENFEPRKEPARRGFTLSRPYRDS